MRFEAVRLFLVVCIKIPRIQVPSLEIKNKQTKWPPHYEYTNHRIGPTLRAFPEHVRPRAPPCTCQR